jgi:hypothetical protein
MITGLISWISVFLLSAPAAPTKPLAQGGDVPLRAHILDLWGIQWRADLVDGLEYLEQHDGIMVWKANAATLKRLVAAAADCRPAGASSGFGFAAGTTRVYHVASFERIAKVSNGETTSLAFKPIQGDVLAGMELVLKGVPAPGGILAEVTIKDSELVSLHSATRREALNARPRRIDLAATLQVPEVLQTTASGRWLIPAGGAVVVGLGVHRQSDAPWGQDPRRERVVVIDAGDVTASVFSSTPRTPAPWWMGWLALLDAPALLTAALGAAFLGGWFVRGNAAQTRDGNVLGPGMEPIPARAMAEGDLRTASRRAPTLADGMGLVAGAAIACLAVQSTADLLIPADLWSALKEASGSSSPVLDVARVFGVLGAHIGVPILAVGSVTLALLIVCRPGPCRSRLILQPGIMACLQVVLVVALITCLGIARHLGASRPDPVEDIIEQCFLAVSVLAGLAVAACWITMVLLGAWRPEAWWADRIGRLLGMAWISILPLALFAVEAS